jgi:tRNA-2-methylthio-N6-dimethylallyladenosine synthase
MFVSIMQGCNMKCSYCIVPYTRGPEQYRDMDSIINEIKFLAKNGTKEVMLLGQIVNNYGIGKYPYSENKSPFVQLLEKIQEIDGIERIRFMSPHPKGFRDDLIDLYGSLSKLCLHVHLPLQSGSDKILKAMHRPYTREKFLEIVEKLRKNAPSISISTDIIVGFPGETEEDFKCTCDIFDAVKFDMAFIFKYSIRPGTPAGEMDMQIDEKIKEERNQILLRKLEKYSEEYNKKMIGKTCSVLVDGIAKRGDGCLCGKISENKKVIFHGDKNLIGRFVNVKITDSSQSTLLGTID